jgi:3-deoxy-7-phosphoheptulonate synthase
MIIVLHPNKENQDAVVRTVDQVAGRFEGVETRPYAHTGTGHSFTEIHLVGPTRSIPTSVFEEIPGVLRVVRVSTRYRLIGRHDAGEAAGFEYNGVCSSAMTA